MHRIPVGAKYDLNNYVPPWTKGAESGSSLQCFGPEIGHGRGSKPKCPPELLIKRAGNPSTDCLIHFTHPIEHRGSAERREFADHSWRA